MQTELAQAEEWILSINKRMKISLSGYNVDTEILSKIDTQKTPETISAAYARISRSKDAIQKLRKDAILEIEKSRNSNQKIIFEMGHSSIAEHAVFNFDICGVSRYLTEFIQKSRMASFTEKSQRYVTFNGDYITPKEIINTSLEDSYHKQIASLTALYNSLFEKSKQHLKNDFEGSTRELDGKAKEDARYVLPLSTETQMGMTINARSLERLLRRLDGIDLEEANELRNKLNELVVAIAPSLIKYTRSDEIKLPILEISNKKENTRTQSNVKLIYLTENAETKILSHILSNQKNIPFEEAYDLIKTLSFDEMKSYYSKIFANMKSYHTAIKEFETIDIEFELLMSASCFGQLKRHRMSTILRSDYSPKNGIIIPDLLLEISYKEQIEKAIADSEKLFYQMEKMKKGLGNYILSNCHLLRVFFKLNLREMYHFARLRSDSHAQWEVRNLSKKMENIIKEEIPFASKMMGGKDWFEENK